MKDKLFFTNNTRNFSEYCQKKEPFYDIFLLCRNTDLTARNAINVA